MEHNALYLHMLGISMYTKNLYEMVNVDFDGKKHIFATGNKDSNYYSLGKSLEREKKETGKPTQLFSPRFFFLLYCSRKVMLHGLFSFIRVLFFFLHPWLWKKCYWVVWGGDLYSAKNGNNKGIKKRVQEWMKRKMIPHFGGVITLTEGDQELVKQWYGYAGDFYQTSYPIPLQGVGMKEKLADRQNISKDCINIVIGNSATETNHHFEALDLLEQYKEHNLHIYLPLAYGFGDWEEYGKKVCCYAEKIFGKDRVTPVVNRMSGEEYTDFMRKMHIAIYNNDRQQAMGNIAIMLAVGAKVYIRTDTNMWNHYLSLNQKLYDVESIKNSSYEEFLHYPSADYTHNFDVLFARNDRRKIVEKWKKILQ